MSHLSINARTSYAAVAASIAGALFASTAAVAEPLAYAPSLQAADRGVRASAAPGGGEQAAGSEVPSHLRRRVVGYQTREAPGTVIIDTPNTQLYYVLGGGRAISYGIGVGREGFTWSGVQTVARMAEWPDWIPPTEMLQRQPYLPRFMAGGPGNPLGARAMYLGGTVYRIHGTNAPETIGTQVSSGCIRMLNEDVIDLYGRVSLGTKVVVLPDRPRVAPRIASSRPVHSRSQADLGQQQHCPVVRTLLRSCTSEQELRDPGHTPRLPRRPPTGSRAAGSSPRAGRTFCGPVWVHRLIALNQNIVRPSLGIPSSSLCSMERLPAPD